MKYLKNSFRHKNGVTGLEIIGAIILGAFLVGLVVIWWGLNASHSANYEETNVNATLLLGLNPNKPSIHQIVFACPGEKVGVWWKTENAVQKELFPIYDDGIEFPDEGFLLHDLLETTNFRLTATNDTDEDVEVAVANVIGKKAGFIADMRLNQPRVDNSTGLLENLRWTYNVPNWQFSDSAYIESVRIEQAPSDWRFWRIKYIDLNDNEITFDSERRSWTDVNIPTISGRWQVTPIDLPNLPLSEAKGQLQLQILLKCE